MKSRQIGGSLAVALTASCLLTACVVDPQPVRVSAQYDYVAAPPPAPVYEAPPPAPGPDAAYVWQAGAWRWEGGRYVWHRGYWGRRPRPGAYWTAPHWEHRDRGYVYIEGRWN